MLATHKNHFTGTTIAKTSDAELNLSDNPRIGFFEFNVLLHNSASHESFSDFIQLYFEDPQTDLYVRDWHFMRFDFDD